MTTHKICDPNAVTKITIWYERQDGEIWALEFFDAQDNYLLKAGYFDTKLCDKHFITLEPTERLVGIASSPYCGSATHHDFQFYIARP